MNEWKDARAIPSARLAIHAHLFTDRSCHGDREGPDIATTQVFTFPLVAEELQLPLLFLIQGVAIANLDRHRGWHAGVTLAPEGSWSPGLRLCSLNTLPFDFTVLVGTWTPPGWGLFQWVPTWDCWPSEGLPKGSKLQSPILGQANEWSVTVAQSHWRTLLATLRARPSGIALLLVKIGDFLLLSKWSVSSNWSWYFHLHVPMETILEAKEWLRANEPELRSTCSQLLFPKMRWAPKAWNWGVGPALSVLLHGSPCACLSVCRRERTTCWALVNASTCIRYFPSCPTRKLTELREGH